MLSATFQSNCWSFLLFLSFAMEEPKSPDAVVLSVVSGPAAPSSPGRLLETLILGLPPRPAHIRNWSRGSAVFSTSSLGDSGADSSWRPTCTDVYVGVPRCHILGVVCILNSAHGNPWPNTALPDLQPVSSPTPSPPPSPPSYLFATSGAPMPPAPKGRYYPGPST